MENSEQRKILFSVISARKTLTENTGRMAATGKLMKF